MQTVLKHALLWLSIYVVYTYMLSFYDDLRARALVNLVNVPLFMVAYYLLKHVQIPLFYKKGKILLFGLSIMLTSFLISAFCRCNGILWMDSLFGKDSENIPFMTMGSYLIKTARFYTPAMAILAWESHEENKKQLLLLQQMEKEKIATELKFLKAQINPHFLFNTLNNLYSYVLKQSPKAPDMIMRLSGILDYVLYTSQNKTVPVAEEIKTIENFLGLEQIRYGDRLQVDFKTAGNMSTSVSPLILLSLVENAFKHGASGDVDHPKIKIDINDHESIIHCKVWNTKSRVNGALNDAYKDGIGLSNIKRQLNLVYPNNHELKIENRNDSFNVSLIIKPKND